jgi:hypothetical protein
MSALPEGLGEKQSIAASNKEGEIRMRTVGPLWNQTHGNGKATKKARLVFEPDKLPFSIIT